MITLITGGPGTGKTAWLLNELIDLRKNEPEKLLYIHGIRNLRGILHTQIFCKSQLCDICRGLVIPHDGLYVEMWPEWKETGSLIIIDEVQRIWRPRTGGSPMPSSVSGLETHRHYGLDFWLISQGPHLFENSIRLLVGRHVHLVSKWNGRVQYEWPECKQDVQSRTDAVTRPYSLPKRVYNLYDSAELHTKQPKRKPLAFYAMISSLVLLVVLGYFVYSRISSKVTPLTTASNYQKKEIEGAPAPSVSTSVSESAMQSFPDFKPVIENLAESAPAYRPLIKVTAAPLLAGCILQKDKCKCYTAQATPYPTSDIFCHEQITNKLFNPYLVASAQKQKTEDITEQPKDKTLNN